MGRTLRSIRSHPRGVIAAAAGIAALAALAAVSARPQPNRATPRPYTPPTRARVYTASTACLLTGPSGIADSHTAPVWAGMQAASHATRAQVSYLTIQGPQTIENADAYINTLAMEGCSLIVTSGTLPGQGATDRAAALPRTRFIAIGNPAATAANITTVTATPADAITREVATLITTELAATQAP